MLFSLNPGGVKTPPGKQTYSVNKIFYESILLSRINAMGDKLLTRAPLRAMSPSRFREIRDFYQYWIFDFLH